MKKYKNIVYLIFLVGAVNAAIANSISSSVVKSNSAKKDSAAHHRTNQHQHWDYKNNRQKSNSSN